MRFLNIYLITLLLDFLKSSFCQTTFSFQNICVILFSAKTFGLLMQFVDKI